MNNYLNEVVYVEIGPRHGDKTPIGTIKDYINLNETEIANLLRTRLNVNRTSNNWISINECTEYAKEIREGVLGEYISEMGARHSAKFYAYPLFRGSWVKELKLQWNDLDPLCDHLLSRKEDGDGPVPGTSGCRKLYWKHPLKDTGAHRGMRIINKYFEATGKTKKGTSVNIGKTALIMCYDKEDQIDLPKDDLPKIQKAVELYNNRIKEDLAKEIERLEKEGK